MEDVKEVDAFADGNSPIFISLSDQTASTSPNTSKRMAMDQVEELTDLTPTKKSSSGNREPREEEFVQIASKAPNMEGLLWKKGAIMRSSWKKRYFRIVKDRIYYYKEKDGSLVNSIPLDIYSEVDTCMSYHLQIHSLISRFRILLRYHQLRLVQRAPFKSRTQIAGRRQPIEFTIYTAAKRIRINGRMLS